MSTKHIAHDFRISFKITAGRGLVVSIRKCYHIDKECRPGLPGMELTQDEFEYLARMKDQLEEYVTQGTRAQCILGGNRQVVVHNGHITLWHFPFVLGPIDALRDSLRLSRQMRNDLWRNEQWILDEFYTLSNTGQDQVSAPTNAEQDQVSAPINTEQDQGSAQINAELDKGTAMDNADQYLETASTPTPPTEAPDPDTARPWWLGAYPVNTEELPAWAATLTQEQLMACPDRQPAPWDDFWDAWQAVQAESRKRLTAAEQPTTARKRTRKNNAKATGPKTTKARRLGAYPVNTEELHATATNRAQEQLTTCPACSMGGFPGCLASRLD